MGSQKVDHCDAGSDRAGFERRRVRQAFLSAAGATDSAAVTALLRLAEVRFDVEERVKQWVT